MTNTFHSFSSFHIKPYDEKSALLFHLEDASYFDSFKIYQDSITVS